MKAAVLHQAGASPRFEAFEDPVPGDGEVLVKVSAASLKPIDRLMASGTHYASFREFPVVCGLDGVGTLEDGKRVFFGGPRKPFGAMAERTVVPQMLCFPVPEGLDDATAAALPNPAGSSWLPLKWRTPLRAGETVLVMGATGVAGKLAVQIAKLLGAGRVIGAGRNPEALESLKALGADVTVKIDDPGQDLVQAFAAAIKDGVDVVLDYLWGKPTEALIAALTGHDFLAQPRITRLVEIGESAGPTVSLPGAALRSSGLEIYGAGGGSVPWKAILEAVPQILAHGARGELKVETKRVALSEVESVWGKKADDGRVVFVP
ncbi:MAG TPA: zinc-binding alcohol dehydrogenase family protein [Candidatus Sulfotelmatobacter sp.]